MTLRSLPKPPTVRWLPFEERVGLRDRLAAAGLNDDALARAGAVGAGQVDTVRLPAVRAALEHEGLPLLLLFMYGVEQPRAVLDELIGPEAVAALEACGLLTGEGDFVHAAVRVVPMAGLLVACDHPAPATPTAVMGPGATTLDLAWAMPRPPVGRVLDVGTGAGSLALLAAAQNVDVVATDITTRAVAFARFNAAFNGLEVDVRAGNLLEPVARDTFDLVVSQPPFVMQPQAVDAITYVHGGETGEELALELIAGLRAVLSDGGIALLRVDTLDDGGFASRVSDAAPELDVVVFGYRGGDVADIAIGYAALADPSLGDGYIEAASHYYRHGTRVAGSHLRSTITVLRKRSGATDALVADVGVRRAPRWHEIAPRLAALDAGGENDATLLSRRLVPPPDARLATEQDLDRVDGEVAFLVRFPADGLLADSVVNETGSLLLQLFAGGAGVGAVAGAYAEVAECAVEDAARDVLAFVRDALARGLLIPA